MGDREEDGMSLLKTLRGPLDLRALDRDQLAALVQEIRDFLIEKVCRVGGHLGPNLGVAELNHRSTSRLRLAARRAPI